MKLPGIDIGPLDHVARVVTSLERTIEQEKSFFADWQQGAVEVLSEHGVRVVMFSPRFEGATKIELLEPLDSTSALNRFLQARGSSVHHLGFKVDDIEIALQRLVENNIRLIDQSPRIGAGGKKIAFLHPSVFQGLLVELVDSPKGNTL